MTNPNWDIWQGLLFLIILTAYNIVRGTGFDIYHIFVIKERHGFNKSTLGLYWSDFIKKQLLLLLFGLPIYWLFMKLI